MKTLNEFIIMMIAVFVMLCVGLLLYGCYNHNEDMMVLSGIAGGIALFIMLMRFIFACAFKNAFGIVLILISIGATSCTIGSDNTMMCKLKNVNPPNNTLFQPCFEYYTVGDTVVVHEDYEHRAYVVIKMIKD